MNCELYYPDLDNTYEKRCKNCGRVIKSNTLIEAYKTVSCGIDKKEDKVVEPPKPIKAIDIEEPSIYKKIFSFAKSLKDFAADGMVLVEENKYEERLKICNTCKFRDNNSCKVCGCNLAIKAAARAFHCPKGYWPGDEGSV